MEANRSLIGQLIGKWNGTVSTWTQPQLPAMTGEISGVFSKVLDGRSVLYEYNSNLDDHRSDGMAVIGKDITDGRLRMAWVDTFHTSSDLMILEEKDSKPGELLLGGSYGAGPETWGWRMVFRPLGDDELFIGHFNVTPDGQQHRAVEIKLQR